MGKLEDISKRRADSHARLLALDSKVYKAFLEMERAAFGDGELSKQMKELIAVGISVVMNCESCMQWHIEQAAKAGASKGQVLEAVEVGIEGWRTSDRACALCSRRHGRRLSSLARPVDYLPVASAPARRSPMPGPSSMVTHHCPPTRKQLVSEINFVSKTDQPVAVAC